jgi:DNA-nicking Smr family endonuclease
MPTRLDHAAKRHREAVAQLEAVRAQVGTARNSVNEARAELAAAIVEAGQLGVRQVEIVKVSGYTRERVRQILRAAGVEAE